MHAKGGGSLSAVWCRENFRLGSHDISIAMQSLVFRPEDFSEGKLPYDLSPARKPLTCLTGCLNCRFLGKLYIRPQFDFK